MWTSTGSPTGTRACLRRILCGLPARTSSHLMLVALRGPRRLNRKMTPLRSANDAERRQARLCSRFGVFAYQHAPEADVTRSRGIRQVAISSSGAKPAKVSIGLDTRAHERRAPDAQPAALRPSPGPRCRPARAGCRRTQCARRRGCGDRRARLATLTAGGARHARGLEGGLGLAVADGAPARTPPRARATVIATAANSGCRERAAALPRPRAGGAASPRRG